MDPDFDTEAGCRFGERQAHVPSDRRAKGEPGHEHSSEVFADQAVDASKSVLTVDTVDDELEPVTVRHTAEPALPSLDARGKP